MYNFSKLPAVFASVASLSRRYRPLIRNNAPIRAFASLSLAALALVVLLASETRAQVPTLEGETFQNAVIGRSRITCDSKTGRIDFSVEGLAAGPYPGIFHETGFLTFDLSGRVTGGNITFDVSNETRTTTVTGKKVAREGTARCNLDTATGVTTISAAVSTLAYSAQIDMTSDSGEATLDLFASIDQRVGLTTLQFTEIFHSSNFVPSTFGKVTGGGNIAPSGGGSGVTFGFNAHNTENGMRGSGTIIDHNAGTRVKILDVLTFAITGTHATFTGRAEVNGVEEKYRIDVDDLGEPGTGMDSFKVVTDSYGSGGTLTGGNIQVHK